MMLTFELSFVLSSPLTVPILMTAFHLNFRVIYVESFEKESFNDTFRMQYANVWKTGFIPSSHNLEMDVISLLKKILNFPSNGPVFLFFMPFHLHLKCSTYLFSNYINRITDPKTWMRPFHPTVLSSIAFIFSMSNLIQDSNVFCPNLMKQSF